MGDDVRTRLAVSHARVLGLVEVVPADGWSTPTPCEEWDVAGLLRHLVAGERVFAALVSDGEADRATIFPAVQALAPADLPSAYADAAAALQAAYAQPGAMERSYVLPIGELPAEQTVALRTIETLTHGWDLATALGATLDVDPAQAEWAIAVSQVLLERLPPGRSPFGTPQPVPADAPALDRLAALLGRRVS